MTNAIAGLASPAAMVAPGSNPFTSLTAQATGNKLAAGPKFGKVGVGTTAPTARNGALAARDMSKHSSRSLKPAERQIVTKALVDAKALLERTRFALTEGWNQNLPNSNSSQRQVFKQYFGGNSEKMRVEVLTRLVRVERLVDRMLSSDIGNSVARATGTSSTKYAYVLPGKGETVYVADLFFDQASTNPNAKDSKAGTLVHELFHLAQYNGSRGVDEVPGYEKAQYGETVLRTLANTRPELAVQNNNLFEWYVERDK
jgi:Lysine-specific metallo-endopeptidase